MTSTNLDLDLDLESSNNEENDSADDRKFNKQEEEEQKRMEKAITESVIYEVHGFLEEYSEALNIKFSKQFAHVLGGVVLDYAKIISKDIEAFTLHAKRKQVSINDVLLLARHNDDLKENLLEYIENNNLKKKSKKVVQSSRKPSSTKRRTNSAKKRKVTSSSSSKSKSKKTKKIFSKTTQKNHIDKIDLTNDDPIATKENEIIGDELSDSDIQQMFKKNHDDSSDSLSDTL